MTTPAIPKRPSRDEFTGDYAEDLDGLLGVIGDAQESLIEAASGVVTPYFKTSQLKHGTETRVRTPLPVGAKCTAISAVKCIGVSLTADGRPSTATYALQVASVGWRSLGRTQDNGEVVGITVQYDLAHTKPFARLGKTAVQAIGNAGAGTAVQWDSNTISADGIISIASSSRIAVSEAGLYLFTGNLEYVTNAAGIRNQLFAYNGATTFTQPDGTRGYVQAMNTGAVFGVAVAGSALFVMAAGSYVEMFGYQNSGGALNITTFSQLQVARLRNDTAPTARVTLIYFGDT